MEIKRRETKVVTINKKTFVVELRDADSDKVLETIGTGKNITDATRIAVDYKSKMQDEHKAELAWNMMATKFIEG